MGISWICFDGGGNEKMPESGRIIENYTRKDDWDFPEWKSDDNMKEAAAYLRVKGATETYGGFRANS